MSAYRSHEGWSALGDPSRRAIVECLAERPRAVGELADALPTSRPAVSQHLTVLKDAGLVAERVAGTRRIYRHRPGGCRGDARPARHLLERAASRGRCPS